MPELKVPMLARDDRLDLLLRNSFAALDFAMSIEFLALTGDLRNVPTSESSESLCREVKGRSIASDECVLDRSLRETRLADIQ